MDLMQRYGLLCQIPRKTMISSSSCCDNRFDFGQCSKTILFLSQYATVIIRRNLGFKGHKS